MSISVEDLYAVTEATWPPARAWREGPWCIRDGQGGGKRVSAATAEAPFGADDVPCAEEAMRGLGQTPLFMIRAGETELDTLLEAQGYAVIDPVNLYLAPVEDIATEQPPKVCAFTVWEPLAIQHDIWERGGIGAARRDVMARADCVKTSLLGRLNDSPAAAGYVGIHQGVAMVHALEVLPHQRRQNMGVYAMRRAAFWAQAQGATHMAVLCTQANKGANALYSSLGMAVVGQYHYRIKEEG